jgi:hypothetical protein
MTITAEAHEYFESLVIKEMIKENPVKRPIRLDRFLDAAGVEIIAGESCSGAHASGGDAFAIFQEQDPADFSAGGLNLITSLALFPNEEVLGNCEQLELLPGRRLSEEAISSCLEGEGLVAVQLIAA